MSSAKIAPASEKNSEVLSFSKARPIAGTSKIKHQIHFWIKRSDYDFLQSLAEEAGEPVSAMLRRIIRNFRKSYHSPDA